MLERKYVTASKSGHQGVAWLLLEREDTNSGAADTKYNQTLLYWAENGEIVKLLLEWEDFNPNTPDTKFGQTPSLRAASCGHEGVVNLLLKREDLNTDIRGFTSESGP